MFWSIAVCVTGVSCTGSNTQCTSDGSTVKCECTGEYTFDNQGTIAVQGPSAESCLVGKDIVFL